MRKRFVAILWLGAALLSQNLRADFVNSDIYKTGTLPNGVEYYMVGNTYRKGVVDIALVQKRPGDVRALLDSLEGMGKRSPDSFLAARGVGYSYGGYAFSEAGAAVYRFCDVPVGASMDSTLFMLSRLTASSPAASTLIMCGDINPATVIDRFGLLSMTIPAREPAPADPEYVWVPRKERSVRYVNNGRENTASVIIRFNIPRLPESARNTAQPILNIFFAQCLSTLLEDRMTLEFKSRNIGMTDFKAVYKDSSSGTGDESYTISFRVLPDEFEKAVSCAASVISGVDRFGVKKEEYRQIRARVQDYLIDMVKNNEPTNSYYVRQCLNACLNGGSLASPQDIKNYFSNRQFTDDRQIYFFDLFSGALLDRSGNVDFTIVSPRNPDVDRIMESFDNGWDSPAKFNVRPVPGFDETFEKSRGLVRVYRETVDGISGGTMWKFSNGMTVIFKRTSGSTLMDYYLIVPGGVQNIRNPEPGEMAFVQDMIDMSGVSSMSRSDFDRVLASKGISVRNSVDYNGLTVHGRIPSSELSYLPTILMEMKNATLPSDADIDYYRKCVSISDEHPANAVNYRIDRLLRPEDNQLGYKFSGNISDSTAVKALEYYRRQMAGMSDGVLLIFGDMHPESVLRSLYRHLCVIPSTRSVAPRDVGIKPHISMGVNMIMDTTSVLDMNSARIRIKLAEPVSRKSNFAFNLTVMCFRETIDALLHECGFRVSCNTDYSLYPEDTFTVTFDIVPCREYGLPLHVGKPVSVLDALAKLHSGLKSGDALSTSNLGLYKTVLTSETAAGLTNERQLAKYILLRYASGRNLTDGYKSQIESVTESDVRDMATRMLKSGRVEYIVR